MIPRRALSGLCALLVLAGRGAGQAPTVVFPGPVGGGEFGTSVAGLGDVDSDGVPDIVVGSPREDTAAGIDAGRVRVLSGATGALIHLFEGNGPDDTFGTAVANAGDVDMDGVADVLAGATEVYPVTSPGPGYAKVFSGATGALIHQIGGPSAGSLFGATIGSVGDCNGDGRSDFFVCANQATRVYSGLTGALLFSALGSRADGGRDVSGDGIQDLVTTGGSSGTTAVMRVYSCATGALVRSQSVPAVFTPRVTLIGDLDFDGRADVIVSDHKSSLGATNSGVVRAFSGFDGVPLLVLAGTQNEFLGWATTALGDVDGDGIDDFATATQWNVFLSGPLHVKVVSGATGAILQTFFEPAPSTAFGWSLGAADLTGDGTPDLLVGVVGDSPNGYASGSVFEFDSATPLYDLVYRDAGCGTTLPDPPAMKLLLSPATASATLAFSAGPPLGTANVVLGSLLLPAFPLLPSGCRLSIDPSQPWAIAAAIPLDAAGAASVPVGLPTNLGGTGITFHVQSLVAAPAGAIALTQGFSLTFN
jgi:hypothetical protein